MKYVNQDLIIIFSLGMLTSLHGGEQSLDVAQLQTRLSKLDEDKNPPPGRERWLLENLIETLKQCQTVQWQVNQLIISNTLIKKANHSWALYAKGLESKNSDLSFLLQSMQNEENAAVDYMSHLERKNRQLHKRVNRVAAHSNRILRRRKNKIRHKK